MKTPLLQYTAGLRSSFRPQPLIHALQPAFDHEESRRILLLSSMLSEQACQVDTEQRGSSLMQVLATQCQVCPAWSCHGLSKMNIGAQDPLSRRPQPRISRTLSDLPATTSNFRERFCQHVFPASVVLSEIITLLCLASSKASQKSPRRPSGPASLSWHHCDINCEETINISSPVFLFKKTGKEVVDVSHNMMSLSFDD